VYRYLLFNAQNFNFCFADSAVAILPVSVRLIARPVNAKIFGKQVNREHHYYAPYSIEYITSMCKH